MFENGDVCPGSCRLSLVNGIEKFFTILRSEVSFMRYYRFQRTVIMRRHKFSIVNSLYLENEVSDYKIVNDFHFYFSRRVYLHRRHLFFETACIHLIDKTVETRDRKSKFYSHESSTFFIFFFLTHLFVKEGVTTQVLKTNARLRIFVPLKTWKISDFLEVQVE